MFCYMALVSQMCKSEDFLMFFLLRSTSDDNQFMNKSF